MKKKTVVIVGAGIAGLSAGVYARRAGHNVIVLEQGKKVGGLCAYWKRGKYHFEGGLHWMLGSSGSFAALNRMWRETGALGVGNPIDAQDPYVTLLYGQRKLKLYRDLDRMNAALLKKSPSDEKVIGGLYRDISLFKLFQSGTGAKALLFRICLAIPLVIRAVQLDRISVRDYVNTFKDKEIRLLLSSIINSSHNALSLVYTMAAFSSGDCGYPIGGSMILSTNMANTLIEKGGIVMLGRYVSRVVVKKGKVCGVISNGEFISADEVIVTSDTCKATNTLFDKPVSEKWAEKLRRQTVSQQCMFVTLGISADMSAYPYSIRFIPERPLEVGGASFDCLEVYNYAHIKEYAPYGCTSMTIILRADCYDWWKDARARGEYIKEKRDALECILKVFASRFPEVEGRIEVAEMATPLTYEHFTDSYRGGWMSIWHPGTFPPMVPPKCRTIKGLHFAGQRTMLSGGTPIALQSGKAAAESL